MIEKQIIDLTLNALLEHGIEFERRSEAIYTKLAQLFAYEEDVAAFWQRYAHEEDSHALILQSLQNRLGRENLDEEVDKRWWSAIQSLKTVLDLSRLVEVATLEDAYQWAKEIEYSELNAIYRYLLEYAIDRKLRGFRQFLLAEINYHIDSLELTFPSRYRNPVARQKLVANWKENSA